MIAYASTRLESLEDAHDIIHDLFVYLWEAREKLDINTSFKSYLFSSLNRRILNHYRSHNYRISYANQLKKMEEAYFLGPDSYVEAKEVQYMIDGAIESMPNKVKEIYLLSREAHLSNKEIAEKLQISEQTVKNQLSTALSILRKMIKHTAIFILSVPFPFYYPFK